MYIYCSVVSMIAHKYMYNITMRILHFAADWPQYTFRGTNRDSLSPVCGGPPGRRGTAHTALTGERKQSVKDVERIFSPSLLAFMEKKGYSFEAKYIRVVLNWRRACDERGLSELERCRFNHQMLNYILDE